MLFDQHPNQTCDLDAWKWQSETNAEVAKRDSALASDAFLGFAGDGDSEVDRTVSIRMKIPHQLQATTRFLSFQRLQ